MSADPKLRLFYLAKILYEQTDEDHFLTTAQLVQLLEEQTELKVHRQTVKADIELLRSIGFEIEEVKSTQNRYNICGRRFETPELKLLIDAVESSKFITAKKSQELVDKLVCLASRHTAELLKKDINCEGRIKPDNEKVYFIVDTINDAINANKKISFQYFQYTVSKEKKLKNNGDPYVITPLHLVWNGDCYYMIGVYDYKQRLGSFRVDRIAKCPTVLDEPGTPAPEGFDIDEYINTTLRMFNTEHQEVELICDNSVIDTIIDRFGEDVDISVVDDNTFRVVTEMAISHVFYGWIFGFGGKVKINAPDNVKANYEKMLKGAMESLD